MSDNFSDNFNELAGLREQILDNYRIIDPDNADAILVTTMRKKSDEELLMCPVVTYRTDHVYEAILVSSFNKGHKILMKVSSPWYGSVAAMAMLHRQTCMILGEKMAGYSK